MKVRIDLYGAVPLDLRDADDLLHRYGRWAKDRMRLHRCGSAERAYRAPRDDKDREPRPVMMHIDQAMACQRALAKVAKLERQVLAILYVPKRIPAEALLRIHHIPPRLCRERHIRGLRMFDNLIGVCTLTPPGTESVMRRASWRAAPSAHAEDPQDEGAIST
jgi:hypothetical protein